jgi:glycosyltransferase involved in cell wall biosynthesis
VKILHTVAGLSAGTGGPVASITSLCAGLASRGHEVTLLTGSGPLHPSVLALGNAVRVRTEALGPYRAAHWSRSFRRACLEEAQIADVVHDHGVWLHTNWSSVRMARACGRPVIRSPRGMLSPWALRRSRLPKELLWNAVERRLFNDSALVHLTSEEEGSELGRLGVITPTVVIPNGVDLRGEFAPSQIARGRMDGIPHAETRRVVLFFSRIHPVKGLDLLCGAWARLPKEAPVLLLLAGPGERAELASLNQWLATQGGPPATYLGAVSGEQRVSLLACAWILVLPSHSENYGMAIAESLACGTPVITTDKTPWRELDKAGCGWVIPPDIVSLARALTEALSLPPDQHVPMRERARQLIERSHSLDESVARMEASYRSVLGNRLNRAEA